MKIIMTRDIKLFEDRLTDLELKGYDRDIDFETDNQRTVLFYNEEEDKMCKVILKKGKCKIRTCEICKEPFVGKNKICSDCEFINQYNNAKSNK